MTPRRREPLRVEVFLAQRRLEELLEAHDRNASRLMDDYAATQRAEIPIRRGPPPPAPRPTSSPDQHEPGVDALIKMNNRRGYPRGRR